MDYENNYYSADPFTSTDVAIILGFLGFYLVFVGIVILFNIIVNYKLFTKAGRPGWYAFVPIFDQVQYFNMIWGTWVPYILLFVPIVNVIIAIIHPFKIAKAFGKDTIFGLLTLFVPFVGLPILAFGSSEYIGPDGEPEYDYYDDYDPRYNSYNDEYYNSYNQEDEVDKKYY